MILSEIFYSIQGEGTLAGVPSAFLCLAGGPPRETWRHPPRERWKPGEEDVFLGPLLAKVRRQWYAHAVITGGEPLDNPDLTALVNGLEGIGQHVTIETSGSTAAPAPRGLMSVNVSLRNPAVPRKAKAPKWPDYDVHAIRELIRSSDYQLKFALSDRAEMEEVVNLVREADAGPDKVLLTPLGPKPKDFKLQKEWMIEASFFFGYRYSPRP